METKKQFAILSLMALSLLAKISFAQESKDVIITKEVVEAPVEGAGKVIIEKEIIKENKHSKSDTSLLKFGNVHVLIFEVEDDKMTTTDSSYTGDSLVKIEKEVVVKEKKEKGAKAAWSGVTFSGVVPLTSENLVYKGNDFPIDRGSSFQLGLFEQKIPINKKHLNIVTGLGLNWAKFAVKRNTTLSYDSSYITASVDTVYEMLNEVFENGANKFQKNNLTSLYLEVPLLVQLNVKKSLHVSAGLVGGWRMGTWYKQVYSGVDGEKIKAVTHDDYHLNNFKYGVLLRVGGKLFDVTASYDLSPLFKHNEGPVLNNFSVGLAVNI